MTESGKILDEDKKDYFKRREISYVKLTADGKEEFTIRHLCYDNPKAFEVNAKQMNPIRIDIGPVCDIPPEVNKNNLGDKKAVAEEREYVIDIDMNDYDSIRTCCSGASMCQSCWRYISAAQKVLEPSLKDDFGFRHILWVFSGRRGVHAWVCDERARVMDNNIRSSVTEYLSLAISNEKSDRMVKDAVIRDLGYGLFNRSYAILEPIFEDFMVVEQAYFWYDKNIERVF
jgi:DNA primase small subunit